MENLLYFYDVQHLISEGLNGSMQRMMIHSCHMLSIADDICGPYTSKQNKVKVLILGVICHLNKVFDAFGIVYEDRVFNPNLDREV